jgi:hypothetical protein
VIAVARVSVSGEAVESNNGVTVSCWLKKLATVGVPAEGWPTFGEDNGPDTAEKYEEYVGVGYTLISIARLPEKAVHPAKNHKMANHEKRGILFII